MQVEDESMKDAFPASGVESALLFESPTELFARVLRTLRPSCAATIEVQFRPSSRARSVARLVGGVLRVRLVGAFESAPAPVLESLAFLLLSKLFRLQVDRGHRQRYLMWLERHDVRKHVHANRPVRGSGAAGSPVGVHHSLEELFEDVNLRFFGGMLARPDLSWSRYESRGRLGHYNPLHHAIVISRVFDRPDTPRVLLDYVMYHEMLHLVHPPEKRGSRRIVHTNAFREAERRFPDLKEAKARLREFLRMPEKSTGSSINGMTGA